MSDHLQYLSPQDFCAQFAPGFGDSWEGAQYALDRDPVERWIIDVLIEDATFGRLREPVRVTYGDENDSTPRVINGVHRVIACLRSHTPVAFTAEPEGDPSNGYLQAVLTFNVGLDEEEHDLVLSVIRSLPVSDDWWASSSDCSSTADTHGAVTVTAIYAIPEDADVDEFTERLNEGLNAALEDARLTVSTIDLSPVDLDA